MNKTYKLVNTNNDIITMEIGKRYLIKTKKGIIKKYLSYVKDGFYYFVENNKEINSSNIGFMFGVRGTVYNSKNIIGEVDV